MKFKFIDWYKGAKVHIVFTPCAKCWVSLHPVITKWRNRGKSNREKENDFLLAKIKDTYAENKGVYGSPRITQALHRQSISCSQPRVARLMRTNGIVAKTQRKFKATTDSNHTLPVAEDIVGQAFAVEGPDRLWVGDITYIDTDGGSI